MAQYRSHKVVCAAQIAAVDPAGRADGPQNTWLLHVIDADGNKQPIDVAAAVFLRYHPEPGDYLMVYPDGYRSVSPKAAFEEGYTRI
jgi:hypothetical protein